MTTAGIERLGGDDFDAILADLAIENMRVEPRAPVEFLAPRRMPGEKRKSESQHQENPSGSQQTLEERTGSNGDHRGIL